MAAEAGHADVVELLLRRGADPLRKCKSNKNVYELAFDNNHKKTMEVISKGLPPRLQPYTPCQSTILDSNQVVTSLSFLHGDYHDKLISGSRDCLVSQLHNHLMCVLIMGFSLMPIPNLSLITAARLCTLCFPALSLQSVIWGIDGSELSPTHEIRVSDTVLGVACHANYIAMGTTSIQLTDTNNFDWRRTVADDNLDDENLRVRENIFL